MEACAVQSITGKRSVRDLPIYDRMARDDRRRRALRIMGYKAGYLPTEAGTRCRPHSRLETASCTLAILTRLAVFPSQPKASDDGGAAVFEVGKRET